MTAKGWAWIALLLQLIVLVLVLVWANPEAVGRWHASACVAEQMFYRLHLLEEAGTADKSLGGELFSKGTTLAKLGITSESMARHQAYNYCSRLTTERQESPQWMRER